MLPDQSKIVRTISQGVIGYDASHMLVKKDVDNGICFFPVVDWGSGNVPVRKVDSQSCRNLLISDPTNIRQGPFGFGTNFLLASKRFWLISRVI